MKDIDECVGEWFEKLIIKENEWGGSECSFQENSECKENTVGPDDGKE